MKYTVKQLKKQIENMNDDDIVCIERIEDVYFEKHGWTTQTHIFNELDPSDRVVFTEAFGVAKIDGKLIICAHY